MITSQAMQRREQVADRAGSLVTERVRALIETAQARAERVRRDAADEARRLDGRRMQAASRIVSQIEDLEGALGRLRQQMQAEHAVEGSYVDEGRLIEVVQDRGSSRRGRETASPSAPPAATSEVEGPTAEVDEPEAEVQEPSDVEEPAAYAEEPPTEVGEHADEVEPDDQEAAADVSDEPVIEESEVPSAETKVAQQFKSAPAGERSEHEQDTQRARFSFRRKRESREAPAGATPGAGEPEPEQRTQEAYGCAVCGRGFAGNEDELKSLGWVVAASGEVTCADCHSAGWLRPSG